MREQHELEKKHTEATLQAIAEAITHYRWKKYSDPLVTRKPGQNRDGGRY